MVELLSSPGDRGVVSFEGFYDTLRNTRDILLKVSNDVKIEDNRDLTLQNCFVSSIPISLILKGMYASTYQSC